MANVYVEGLLNWLCPPRVNLSAMPNALTDMTETDPTVEQIEMNTKGFFFPCFGATLYIITQENTATAAQYNKNPERISVGI